MTWRQIPKERRLQCLPPPAALNNSDDWASLLRGTKLEFKFHSEKFKTVEHTDSGVIVVITETYLTSADTEDDQFAVIIRPVHGFMNENTGRSLPSMNVLHSEDLLTPPDKNSYEKRRNVATSKCVAVQYVTIRAQTSRGVRYREHKESCTNRTRWSHQTCQAVPVVLYLPHNASFSTWHPSSSPVAVTDVSSVVRIIIWALPISPLA